MTESLTIEVAEENRPAGTAAGSGARPDTVRDRPRSPLRRTVRRFARNPLAMLALGYLVLILAVAIFGRWIAPYDPNRQQFKPFLGPSTRNWLGTDDIGRDVASRLIAGTAVSVRASYQTVAMALAVAVPIGLIAGYVGGRTDNLLMRVMDAFMSFPPLILALVIASTLGPGLGNAMIAITIVLVPSFVRLIRASTLAVAQETFVEASRSIGTRTRVILRRRVLPSVVSPIIVTASLVLGAAMVAEASLSFLGLGTQPPNASWGSMLKRGFTYINSNPFQMVPPGVAIALAVLSFNMVGDALRDALGLAETAPPRGTKRGRMGLTTVVPASSISVASPSVGSAAGTAAAVDAAPLLAVRDLTIEFVAESGPLTVVDGVSFDVRRGEVVGLVGESGSGKTVTSMAIMRLLPTPPARIAGGQVLLDGQDLLRMPFKELAKVRGNAISMVFQDPMSSLNPAYTVGNQLVEAVRLHQHCSKEQARARALELLDLVAIPDRASRMKEYPHRLSGGMRQRVLIAMALANRPKLLIADEPTTALDVTVQAQILDLLKSLQREFDMAMIFVSHDLGVIADIADRAIVMYAGQLVEEAPVRQMFAAPKHPYTRKLLTAIPQSAPVGGRLPFIAGVVPPPGQWPTGCRFASRCDFASADCRGGPVPLSVVADHRTVRCIKAGDLELESTP